MPEIATQAAPARNDTGGVETFFVGTGVLDGPESLPCREGGTALAVTKGFTEYKKERHIGRSLQVIIDHSF